MVFPDEITVTQVTFTQSAAHAVRDVMEKKNLQDFFLRLYISGGGCSGYQYGLVLDKIMRDGDVIVETDGVRLLIDNVSINYLQGATVDYVEGMTASGFKIINPNAASSCGCGQSADSSEGNTDGSCCGCG